MATLIKRSPANRSLAAAGVIAWIVCCSIGLGVLARHAATPGDFATTRERWPARSRLKPPTQIPTLLIFLHPQCPCSTATLGELERATAGVENRCRIVFVVYTPSQSPSEWSATSLCERASSLAHATIVTDTGGREAALFGATTSGHAMLFASNGERLFEGGLTSSRGHEGDNDGSIALRSLLLGNDAIVRSTPVYGCQLGRPIHDRDEERCELCVEREVAK